ncbi:MAG: hypothetical protein ACXABV_17160 [Candidatus Thorarchaeota archaeon]
MKPIGTITKYYPSPSVPTDSLGVTILRERIADRISELNQLLKEA